MQLSVERSRGDLLMRSWINLRATLLAGAAQTPSPSTVNPAKNFGRMPPHHAPQRTVPRLQSPGAASLFPPMTTPIKILLYSLIAFFITGALHAEVADLEEARALSDQIMRSIGTGDYKTAFETAAAHWPLPKEEIDAARAKTDEQLSMVGRRFGTL